MKRLFACALLLFAAAPSLAADANGYTAKYECRAGNPNCNVDVNALGLRACDQEIFPSTSPTNSWSVINWSNDTICIHPGDHRGRGTLAIVASGTSGNRKVIRYVRSNDNGDHPWNQSDANKAKVRRLTCSGQDFVFIHRITFWPDANDEQSIVGCQDIILNRVLVDNRNQNPTVGRPMVKIKGQPTSPYRGNNRTTLQNSVVRGAGKRPDSDQHCLNVGKQDIRIVNNEIYNCGGDGIVMDQYSDPRRNKIENNDIYQTSDYLIGCDGNPGTTCNCGEDGIDIKDNAATDRSDQIEVVHNRISGWRTTYQSCSGSGSAGFGVNAGDTGPKNFVLIKNNIFSNLSNGVNARSNTSNWSIIGNLFSDVNHAHTPQDFPSAGDGEYSIAIRLASTHNHQIYLNTVVNSKYGLWIDGGGTNNDLRCNVFLNVPNLTRASSSTWGSGSTADYNAFFNAGSFAWGATQNNTLIYGRADDSQAQSYCYNRKLHSGQEQTCIPYVRTTPSSPHYQRCDPDLGSRIISSQ